MSEATQNSAEKNDVQEQGLPKGLDPQALYEKNIERLQELAAQQVSEADTSKPTTMTEILANPEGALALKAQDLGLGEAFKAFVDMQGNVAKLREDFIKVEEQRSTSANAIANITPQLQAAEKSVRKTSGIAGLMAGVGTLVATVFATGPVKIKNFKSPGLLNITNKPGRIIITVAATIAGGFGAAVLAAKRSSKKSIEKIEKQVGDLSKLGQDPELEKQAFELQQQLGEEQKTSINGLVNAMAVRMTEVEVEQLMQTAATEAQKNTEMAAAQQEAGKTPDTAAKTDAAVKEEPAQVNMDEKQQGAEVQPSHQPAIGPHTGALKAAERTPAMSAAR